MDEDEAPRLSRVRVLPALFAPVLVGVIAAWWSRNSGPAPSGAGAAGSRPTRPDRRRYRIDSVFTPMDSLLPPLTSDPPRSMPLEELIQTIMRRENLGPGEHGRCRREVLLQLAFSSPWSEADAAASPAAAPSRARS